MSGTMMSRSRTWTSAQVAGTVVYMAPEYLKTGTSTPKVDAFAFGLTLVVTLLGMPAERACAGSGGEQHTSLLDLFYDELSDDDDAFVRRLDPHASAAHGAAGAWDGLLDAVRKLHGLAAKCLEHRAKQRVEIRQVVPELEACRSAAEGAQPPAPSQFTCPLSLETMVDPVVAADGVTYERAIVERWLREHDTSPANGAKLAHKFLTPNLALRDMIRSTAQR